MITEIIVCKIYDIFKKWRKLKHVVNKNFSVSNCAFFNLEKH